jgi:hypothetical protein
LTVAKQEDRAELINKGPVTGLVGLSVLPADVLARSPLAADYVDHFSLPVDTRANPEQYARAMFGDVPSAAEVFIWRGLLQLRLSKGVSPHSVAGWRIAESSPDWIRLHAQSHSLTVHLVVSASSDQLELTTLVKYDRRLGRWAWDPLSAVHRRLAPSLLVNAAARVSR